MDVSLIVAASLVLIVLIIMSAFFSASETSYTSVSRIRLKNLAKDGNKSAKTALRLVEDYNKLLTAILIGNNLVNILASSICTWMFNLFFEGMLSVALSTAFMLVVILTFGEITPKTLAKRNPEKVVIAFASTLSVFVKIFAPVTFAFTSVFDTIKLDDDEQQPSMTEEELVVMIDEIEGEGTLEKSESELIKSAIEFNDKQVSEIITPRVDVVAVEKSATMEDMKRTFLNSGFSRIPVYDGTIDRIIGVVYSKDFYSKYFENVNVDMEELMRPVKFTPETTLVANIFAEMQKSMVQMVVVVDSYGGTVGIASMEDILEELVGEIWDENDEVQYPIVREIDGTYAVLGEANISDLMDEIGVELNLGDYDDHTVGGFIQYKLNRVPIKGDRLEDDNIKMIVRSMKNRRVKLVQVTVKSAPEQSAESE